MGGDRSKVQLNGGRSVIVIGIVTEILCGRDCGVGGAGRKGQYLINQRIIQSKQWGDEAVDRVFCRMKIPNFVRDISD